MVINRHLANDTFDVDVKMYETAEVDNKERSPYLNVSNAVEMMDLDQPGFNANSSLGPNGWWKYHHSLLRNKRFVDSSVIVGGMDGTKSNNLFPLLRTIIFPEHIGYSENVVSVSNQTILLRSIKKIKVKIDSSTSSWFTPSNDYEPPWEPIDDTTLKLETEYNDIYIVPIQPNYWETNKKIAKVYSGNTDASPDQYDLAISKGQMKTTSLKSSLDVYFNSQPNPSEKIKNTNATFKGYLEVSNPTYYDYEKEETIKGFGEDFNIGETIPYNFSGDFRRVLTMGFNASFPKINLSFSSYVKTPILDKFDGKVLLRISSSEESNTIPAKYLEENDILKIKENDISLEGIERLLQ